jgi:hypothetical protein
MLLIVFSVDSYYQEGEYLSQIMRVLGRGTIQNICANFLFEFLKFFWVVFLVNYIIQQSLVGLDFYQPVLQESAT